MRGRCFCTPAVRAWRCSRKSVVPPLTAGNDLNHLALNVAPGTYDTLRTELEKHGITVTGRPGEDRCIYFRDLDGHRLQLMVDK